MMQLKHLKNALFALSVVAPLYAMSAIAQTTAVAKSVGADGTVTYGDAPVAGAISQAIVLKEAASGTPQLPLRAQPSTTPATEKSSPTATVSNLPVLFFAHWCPYCQLAIKYLKANNIAYRAINVDTAEGSKLRRAAGNGRGIPLLVVGDQQVRGWSEAKYEKLLKKS